MVGPVFAEMWQRVVGMERDPISSDSARNLPWTWRIEQHFLYAGSVYDACAANIQVRDSTNHWLHLHYVVA